MATRRMLSSRSWAQIATAVALLSWQGLADGEAHAELLARYSFNETNSSSELADSAGTANGILNSMTFTTSGAGAAGSTGFGNAGVFNGSDGVVLFGFGEHPASFNLGGDADENGVQDDFTIAGWFKTVENTVNEDRAVFQSQSFSGGGWSFEIGRADRTRRGKIFFTVGGGPSTTFGLTQPYSDIRLDDNQWHWVAVTHNAGAISMFVDGALQLDTGTMQPTSTATAPVATEAAFGARAGITPYQGELDEWSIYNHALTGTLSGGASGTLTGGELYDLWQQGVVETTDPGDFDGDGDVDGRDFLAWQRGNSPTPYSTADLNAWQNAYGGGALAAINAVPEPTSCVIAMLCLAWPAFSRSKFQGRCRGGN